MADGILGLGSSGSTGLSTELITKLKTAESTAKITPIEEDLADLEIEQGLIEEISAKVVEFLDAMALFDLYNSDNSFEAFSADTTGTSAIFDALDTTELLTGTTSVTVTQLAKRDVYQSDTFSDADTTMSSGQNSDDKITIELNGETFEFTTQGKTYQELADAIDYETGLSASIEQVGTNAYRLIIKSTETGEDNALTITQSSGLDLGYDDETNHTLSAQNMISTIDGINYNVSSNTITTGNGLSITAVSLGDSSINLQKDTSGIFTNIESFVDLYNELIDMVDEAVNNEEITLVDDSSITLMMSQLKNMFMDSYGDDDSLSLFNFGFSFDTDGYLSVDESTFEDALSSNYDDLKELFIGVAEKPGLGTTMKEYVDGLDGTDGLLTNYIEMLDEKQTTWEEEKEVAQEKLDEKYTQLQLQFAEYTAIITTMENSFAGLKQIIADSSDS